MNTELEKHVYDHMKFCGCHLMNHALGIQQMPEGYALMLDGDEMYYYFLRQDGKESPIHWNRWAIYRWAKQDHKNRKKQ